ncbi:MAG: ComF family protein [Methyloprofundus sp.]|nr:ComF family protein [Methyloprofundus sp.]
MINKVNNWCNIIQYSLLPATCILCNQSGMPFRDLCQPCHAALLRTTSHCLCCASEFSNNLLIQSLCGKCQNKHPAFEKTYAPFTHQGAIRHLIAQLKFNRTYKYSRLLGQLLAEYIQKEADRLPELIIPVPLHPQRYRRRGFNQTLEIGKIVAHELAIPIDSTSCQRQKNTEKQSNLTGKQRHKNIRNAFKVLSPPTATHIAIIDDVMTTGATVNELAKTLKAANRKIERIDIWVCARAQFC